VLSIKIVYLYLYIHIQKYINIYLVKRIKCCIFVFN